MYHVIKWTGNRSPEFWTAGLTLASRKNTSSWALPLNFCPDQGKSCCHGSIFSIYYELFKSSFCIWSEPGVQGWSPGRTNHPQIISISADRLSWAGNREVFSCNDACVCAHTWECLCERVCVRVLLHAINESAPYVTVT